MPAEAFLSHRTPERLRLKIPSRKGDAAFFDAIRRKCETLPGVSRVEANPLTGSLLLILGMGANLSLPDAVKDLDLVLKDQQQLTLEKKAARELGEINRKVRDFTGGELDFKSVAFLGCLAAGVYQISIGNLAVPAWFVAFWYAMNLAEGES